MLQVMKGLSLPGDVRLEEGSLVDADDLDPTICDRLIARGLLTPVETPTPEAQAARSQPRRAKTSPNPKNRSRRGTAASSEES